MLDGLFDLVLVVAVVGLAWRALTAADLFQAVVLFIVFGILLSLAWVRLQAPAIALAEAAIGAGLTGALLLDAVSDLRGRPAGSDRGRGARGTVSPLAVLLIDGAGGVLWLAAVPAQGAAGLGAEVATRLAESGVSQPVTAVLLNFRGYDTLLEVAVLVAAVLGVLALQRSPDLQGARRLAHTDPVLAWLARLLVPMVVLVGGYLLWLGTRGPGGAFQAGAVLGAGLILLRLAGYRSIAAVRGWRLRAALLAGFALFLLVAVGVAVDGRQLLEYPPAWAGPLILLSEAAVAISTAVILATLFTGGAPGHLSDPTTEAPNPADRANDYP